MTTKNRTLRSFVTLVPDYTRSKCEKYEAGIHRCLQVFSFCLYNVNILQKPKKNIYLLILGHVLHGKPLSI